MKTIRITIDEPLLHQIDRATEDRSAFIRQAVRRYFKALRLKSCPFVAAAATETTLL
jgi:metal-responsive CopG/Arc/MetJ family transcriptional regulator